MQERNVPLLHFRVMLKHLQKLSVDKVYTPQNLPENQINLCPTSNSLVLLLASPR